MGIEDFNLYSDEFTDKVVVVSNSDELKSQISSLLLSRNLFVQTAGSLEDAAEMNSTEIWDMVVLHTQEQDLEVHEISRQVKNHARLSRALLIVLFEPSSKMENTPSLERDSFSKQVITMPLPLEPAHFLVKVATLLRLRKLQMDNARVESEIAMQNSRLRDLTTRFQHELRQAQMIQQSLMPKSLPKHPKCFFAASYVPLEAVGGDIFDIWSITDDTFGFFIADVTGHGLPAAFIGAMTKMALSYAPKESPDIMLTHMAGGITDHMPEGSFVTVAAATFNVSSMTLKLAKGGHPSPYLWRKRTQFVEELSPKGLPLGILKEAKYQLIETQLEPGDKLLMITDGLTETFDMNGAMLGSDGLAMLFAECAPTMNIAKCIEDILQKQKEFSGGRILKDDNTLIGLEISSK